MKKITTILMLLMLSMGAWAQNITTATYGNGNGTFYNAAGNVITSGFEGKKFVSNTTPAVTIESSYTGGLNAGDAVNGARIGTDNTANNTDGVTTYTISVPDGYEITEYSLACWAVNGGHPAKTLTDGKGATYDVSSTTQKTVSCTDINAQTTNFKLTTTVQAWSPIRTNNFVIKVKKVKFNLVYKCYMEGETEPFETVTSTEMYNDGEVTITDAMVPEFTGKAMTSHDASVTINGADAEVNVYYAAASINYSVALKYMPEGTVVTIGNTTVADGDTYVSENVLDANDVNVTYPAGMGFDDEKFAVFVEDATVTIARGTLINIATSTGQFYFTNGNTLTPSTNNQYGGKWVSTATAPSLTFTTTSNDMIVNLNHPTDTKFNLHGKPNTFTFSTDEGYVVKYYSISAYATNGGSINGTAVSNNANNPTTVKVEGDDATTMVIAGTSNPWMYITNLSVLVQVVPSVPVTYIIQEGGQTIYTSDPVLTAIGTTVTELPDDLKRSAWYDYDPISVNVTAETTTITVAATAKENQPVKYTEDTTSPYYYNMNIRSKYLVYNSTATGEVTLQNTSEPFNPAASWAFVGTPYDGFRLINQDKGTGYNLIYTSVVTGNNANNNNIQFQTVADAGEKVWLVDTNNSGIVLRMKENQSIYFHHDNGKNFLRTCSKEEWGSVHTDLGSTIILTTDKEVLVQLYNVLNEKKDFVGEGLNKYSVSGMTADEFLTLLNDVKSDLDNDNTGNFLNDYNALNAVTIAINQPETNSFLRIKSAHGTYLSGVASTEEAGRLSLTTATDASTIFFFDGNKLLTYGNGLYANGRAVAALGGEGLNYQFEASTVTVAKYAIRFNPDGEEDRWLYAHDTTKNYADQNKSDAANCAFELEEVTELPITLRSTDGTNYFATFSAPVNVEISGASLNNVQKDGNTATFTTVNTNVLKAGVGVLLSGTSESATATIITEDVAEADYGLVSYYAATAGTGDETKYYLGKSKKNGQAGFYKLGSGTTSNGFKAYLENTTGEAKEGFDLEFAGVTGIDNMENGTLNMENGAVYNLQGQRVNKAQKGVFIQNGKKVVLK